MAFNYQNFASLGVNLNRQKYGPLDISSVFAKQADLTYYLTKGTKTEGVSEFWYKDDINKVVPYPYAGQLIATAFEGEPVKVFVLSEKEDGTFETKNVGDTSAVEADLSDLQGAVDTIKATIGTEATADAEATGFYKLFSELQANITANTEAIGTKATDDAAATGIYKLIEDSIYDDTSVLERIKTIEDDYLTSSDRADIDESITEAADAARDAAIKAVLTGEETGAISEAYDTIKEIADWIESGDSEGLDLIQRVAAIESDYLTESDKYDDSAVVGRLDSAEAALEDLTIKSADTTEFTVTDGILAVNKIAKEKVDGLVGTLTDHETRVAAIEADYLTSKDRYDDTEVVSRLDTIDAEVETLTIKSANVADFTVNNGVLNIIEGKRLITTDEATKLSKLILNEDGSVTTGQRVAAGDVDGLAEWLTNNRNTVEGLFSDAKAATLDSAIQGIVINGTKLEVAADKTVELSVATASALGLVKGVTAVTDEITGQVTNPNTVAVKDNGELEVNAISTDKLVQGEDELILFGGSASDLK